MLWRPKHIPTDCLGLAAPVGDGWFLVSSGSCSHPQAVDTGLSDCLPQAQVQEPTAWFKGCPEVRGPRRIQLLGLQGDFKNTVTLTFPPPLIHPPTFHHCFLGSRLLKCVYPRPCRRLCFLGLK